MSKDSSVFAGSECTKAKFKMRERGRGKVEEKKKSVEMRPGDGKKSNSRGKRERGREKERTSTEYPISNLKHGAQPDSLTKQSIYINTICVYSGKIPQQPKRFVPCWGFPIRKRNARGRGDAFHCLIPSFLSRRRIGPASSWAISLAEKSEAKLKR